MVERKLTSAEAASAAAIQQAIDQLAGSGGRLVLPAMELELDRGLHLRSGMEVVGQGEATVLRKGPGRIYPLSGYHNYGMCDVPLRSAAGLEVGMTVSIHDGDTHGGFYETFATITWIDGDWVGLDHGIEADYSGRDAPCLTTLYPLVFAHNVDPHPTEVHSCLIRNCDIRGNALEGGKGQVEIENEAHDLIFVNNRIAGNSQRPTAGFALDSTVRSIYLEGNSCENCAADLAAAADTLADEPPQIECGYGSASEAAYRHLNYQIAR